MARVLDNPQVFTAPARSALAYVEPRLASSAQRDEISCFHCGELCAEGSPSIDSKVFCCQGCLFVHDLLTESGLTHFYELKSHPGVSLKARDGHQTKWQYLDDVSVQQQLLDFTNGKVSRVTFSIPAIHCVACVWLLENLFQMVDGVGHSRVNFPRRELAVSYDPNSLKLSKLAAFLASIGYEPELTLSQLDKPATDNSRKRRWLQIGIAGFAFGNIMLLSLPGYLGLDAFSGPLFKAIFGYVSLALALPVVLYSASDYWRAAWLAIKQRVLTLDVPIALGLAALYGQSALEILAGHGEGYLDSLAGLIFLLLCGRVFQEKTHDRIAFDRDFRCFFPLSATRLLAGKEESVAISTLQVGDRVRLRNSELLPADARLVSPSANIDYSFVTGESEPVERKAGDYLYAGGRHLGPTIEVETVKPVSHSYLTSLWNDEVFQKDREDSLNTLTNRYSRRFTLLVLSIAIVAAIGWSVSSDPVRGIKAFTSVLIVACPCALALAAPFTLGSAQRLFSRQQVFLKSSAVTEKLARVDTIVFDKTGTLTQAAGASVRFEPRDQTGDLNSVEAGLVASLASQSTHPLSMRISSHFPSYTRGEVTGYEEAPGRGIQGIVAGRKVSLGSRPWLISLGVKEVPSDAQPKSAVCLTVDGEYRGCFQLANDLRPAADALLVRLSKGFEIHLLSGDNNAEQERLSKLFGNSGNVHFNQSPFDKLGFIRKLKAGGRTVMMAGDGLNDAGALKAADVGLAVVENTALFSPSSDMIIPGSQLDRLPEIFAMARQSTRIVRLGFAVSAGYNAVGVSIAAWGILSPLICAVLMPLSSVSVVLFACGASNWAARRLGLITSPNRSIA